MVATQPEGAPPFMDPSKDIIGKSSGFVSALLAEKLPGWAVYHNLGHTTETVAAAREIAEGSRLNKSDTEVVLLAAWFHDTGYAEKTVGHEERSSEIARGFLTAQGYPAGKTDDVVRCILATRVPQHPADLLEQVICDADMRHLGSKMFFEKNDLLREEIERREGRPMTDVHWLGMSTGFVSSHRFHTGYALREFEPCRTENISRLQEELRKAEVAAGGKSGQKFKKLKRGDVS